jgi:hypothetical protein
VGASGSGTVLILLWSPECRRFRRGVPGRREGTGRNGGERFRSRQNWAVLLRWGGARRGRSFRQRAFRRFTFRMADSGGATRVPSHGFLWLLLAESAEPIRCPRSRPHTRPGCGPPASSERAPGRRELAFPVFQVDQQGRYPSLTQRGHSLESLPVVLHGIAPSGVPVHDQVAGPLGCAPLGCQGVQGGLYTGLAQARPSGVFRSHRPAPLRASHTGAYAPRGGRGADPVHPTTAVVEP